MYGVNDCRPRDLSEQILDKIFLLTLVFAGHVGIVGRQPRKVKGRPPTQPTTKVEVAGPPAHARQRYGDSSMAYDEMQLADEIDKLLAADPNANVVEGEGTTVWLATGDQMKLVRDLVAKKQKQSE